MRKSKRVPSVEELRERACALCVRAEQCEYDIRQKLTRWGATNDISDMVIDFLFEHNFLNEDRYAESFAHDKALFSGWGRIKIKAALRMKHIDETSICKGLDNGIDPDDYIAILNGIAKNKARQYNLEDYRERMKLNVSLRSRGYEADLVSNVINRIINATDVDS